HVAHIFADNLGNMPAWFFGRILNDGSDDRFKGKTHQELRRNPLVARLRQKLGFFRRCQWKCQVHSSPSISWYPVFPLRSRLTAGYRVLSTTTTPDFITQRTLWIVTWMSSSGLPSTAAMSAK